LQDCAVEFDRDFFSSTDSFFNSPGIYIRFMLSGDARYMNCPHCQKELPENYSAMWCPFCGLDLSPVKPLQEASPFKIYWPFFFVALLLPPFLTLVSALCFRSSNEGVSPMVGMIGGAIGGIICGAMIGCQGSTKLPIRIVLGVVMSAVMIFVCILLCFFGCTAGGYQFRID
jgi:hypothetical protein